MRIHFFNSNENREWARKVISLPPRNQTGLGTPEGYGLLRTLSLQIFEQVDWSRIYRDPITDWNKTVLVRISTAVIKHHDQKASWGAEEFFFSLYSSQVTLHHFRSYSGSLWLSFSYLTREKVLLISTDWEVNEQTHGDSREQPLTYMASSPYWISYMKPLMGFSLLLLAYKYRSAPIYWRRLSKKKIVISNL